MISITVYLLYDNYTLYGIIIYHYRLENKEEIQQKLNSLIREYHSGYDAITELKQKQKTIEDDLKIKVTIIHYLQRRLEEIENDS